jgi:hypothetical protein
VAPDRWAILSGPQSHCAQVKLQLSVFGPHNLGNQTSGMYLGYIDLGHARLNEALSEARGLDHAYTLAWVLSLKCEAAWAVSLPRESSRYTEELLTLSNAHAFPFWSAQGSLHRGWPMARLGNAKEGPTALTKGSLIVVPPRTLVRLRRSCYWVRPTL